MQILFSTIRRRTTLDGRLAIGIFVTCILLYAIFWSGHQYSIDGIIIFQNAKAILFQGSFVMNPPVRWGVDMPLMGSAPGLTFAYIPILVILSLTFFAGSSEFREIPYDPQLEFNPTLLANSPYLYSSFLNPLITSATAVVVFLLCRQLELTPKRAAAAALVFGLASPAAVYAKFDFNQPLVALCLVAAFLFVILARKHGSVNLVIAGVCLGYALLTRFEFSVTAMPALVIAIYFLHAGIPAGKTILSPTRWVRLALFAMPVSAFVILNQYTNFLRYGNWVSVGYYSASVSNLFVFDPARFGSALLGNLFSPGRGILLFYPICILSIAGFFVLLRKDRLVAIAFGVFIIGAYSINSAFVEWHAGVSWGPRYTVPLIPYLTILAFIGVDLLHRFSRWTRISLYAIFIIAGALVAVQGFLFDFQGLYSNPQISPILLTLNDLSHPESYDIYWLKNIDTTKSWTLIVFLTGCALFSLTIFAWLKYFNQSDSPSPLESQT